MQGLLAFFWGFGIWNWLILAVVLFTLETFVPGVHFLWFGLAAVIRSAQPAATITRVPPSTKSLTRLSLRREDGATSRPMW